MASPHPAHPIYHDPTPTRPRDRRSSSRRSFASSLSRSTSYLDSPRAACPKDGDAFSYNPAYLRAWYLPQELWNRLPGQMQSNLAAVQHSGAAVLTGFQRLDAHTEGLDNNRLHTKIADDVLFVHLDDLPSKPRTTSNASSVFHSDFSSPATASSPFSQSGCASPVTTPSMPQATTPPSPASLGHLNDERGITRERSFSTPLEPHDAYYATELSHLRTEALPRLRHAGHKIDTEWYEAKRTHAISDADIKTFESWWSDKKNNILDLTAKGKRLATSLGLASTGMGWSAP